MRCLSHGFERFVDDRKKNTFLARDNIHENRRVGDSDEYRPRCVQKRAKESKSVTLAPSPWATCLISLFPSTIPGHSKISSSTSLSLSLATAHPAVFPRFAWMSVDKARATPGNCARLNACVCARACL